MNEILNDVTKIHFFITRYFGWTVLVGKKSYHSEKLSKKHLRSELCNGLME